MKKITLSVEDHVLRDARRLARRRDTSISALFSNYIRALAGNAKAKVTVPPDSIAARATGFLSLPRRKSERDVLSDALIAKYGVKR